MTLIAEELAFKYSFRGGESAALRGFSGEFTPGIPHLICGPSGSGKSTLGLLLAGLLSPTTGSIRWNESEPASQRSKIAYVFQFAESIFFEDSLREELKQWTQSSSSLDLSSFARLGIDFDRIADTHPFHLSQGMSRLVAIALQVARDPELLILDEPTIGLDWDHYWRVIQLLKNWVSPRRILIVITHDLEVIRELGGQAWVLNGGELAWCGETGRLLEDQALLTRYDLEA